MNRKLFVLLFGIIFLGLTIMIMYEEDKPTGIEIMTAIETLPVEGFYELIDSVDKIEYLYNHIGNKDYNFARVMFELTDKEVDQLKELLVKTDFKLYRTVDTDDNSIDYTGDGFDYIISYDDISYRLFIRHAKVGTDEVGSGISLFLWPTNTKEAKELIVSSNLGPIAKLSGPLMSN